MYGKMRSLVILGLFIGIIIYSNNASALTYIDDCTTINTSGYYKLNNSFPATGSECIVIEANDTVLDCDWHTINTTSGNIYGYVFGVSITPSSTINNITIKNCNFEDIYGGIYAEKTSNINITNINCDNFLECITLNPPNYAPINIYNVSSYSSVSDSITIFLYNSDNATIEKVDSGVVNGYGDISIRSDNVVVRDLNASAIKIPSGYENTLLEHININYLNSEGSNTTISDCTITQPDSYIHFYGGSINNCVINTTSSLTYLLWLHGNTTITNSHLNSENSDSAVYLYSDSGINITIDNTSISSLSQAIRLSNDNDIITIRNSNITSEDECIKMDGDYTNIYISDSNITSAGSYSIYCRYQYNNYASIEDSNIETRDEFGYSIYFRNCYGLEIDNVIGVGDIYTSGLQTASINDLSNDGNVWFYNCGNITNSDVNGELRISCSSGNNKVENVSVEDLDLSGGTCERYDVINATGKNGLEIKNYKFISDQTLSGLEVDEIIVCSSNNLNISLIDDDIEHNDIVIYNSTNINFDANYSRFYFSISDSNDNYITHLNTSSIYCSSSESLVDYSYADELRIASNCNISINNTNIINTEEYAVLSSGGNASIFNSRIEGNYSAILINNDEASSFIDIYDSVLHSTTNEPGYNGANSTIYFYCGYYDPEWGYNCNNTAIVNLYNTTYDTYFVNWTNTQLNVYWLLSVDNPLGATVSIYDYLDNLVSQFSDITNELWLREFYATQSGVTNTSEYTINAEKSGYEDYSTNIVMSSNLNILITMAEIIPSAIPTGFIVYWTASITIYSLFFTLVFIGMIFGWYEVGVRRPEEIISWFVGIAVLSLIVATLISTLLSI